MDILNPFLSGAVVMGFAFAGLFFLKSWKKTRDGLFLIEGGEITRPVVNFRWNESPAAVLRSIEAMTPAERVVTREGSVPIVAPPESTSFIASRKFPVLSAIVTVVPVPMVSWVSVNVCVASSNDAVTSAAELLM